jgi:hypothetical protein
VAVVGGGGRAAGGPQVSMDVLEKVLRVKV